MGTQQAMLTSPSNLIRLVHSMPLFKSLTVKVTLVIPRPSSSPTLLHPQFCNYNIQPCFTMNAMEIMFH